MIISERVQKCQTITTCWSATCIWKIRRNLYKHAGEKILPNQVGGPGGQSRKKDVCRLRIVHVLRTPGMHRGRGGGMAAVQSSYNFICCSGVQAETTRRGECGKKSTAWWSQVVKLDHAKDICTCFVDLTKS